MSAIPEHPLAWMPKSVWAPMKWKELHCRALAYLPMDGEKKWFDSFVKSLPCPDCQSHFELIVKQNPPDFTSRPAFFEWTVLIHNKVNQALGKNTLDIEQALVQHFPFQ